MTPLEFLTNVNYAVKGTDDDVPTQGDDDANEWLTIYNRKKREMYRDVKQNWASAYEDRSQGTIAVSAAPTFNLDTDFLAPATQVYVIDSNGQYYYYDVVKPQEIDRTKRQFYVSGKSPKVLHCSNPIVTNEQIIGGTLHVPGYWMPDDIDISNAAAVIDVDDPDWAVMAVAAQVAFGDITYEDKFEDLNGQANVLYRNMARTNRRGNYASARVTPTRVNRIPGFRR